MWEPLLIIIIIICYIYIALFWVLKALYILGSPRPPPMCSIHLFDATAAIVCQNANHTPAYWWRGERVMKPISVWGWLGGQWGNLARMLGLHPYSFSKDILGFLMTIESQDLGLTSHPKDGWLPLIPVKCISYYKTRLYIIYSGNLS